MREAIDVERLALALRIVDQQRKPGAYPHLGPDPDAIAAAIAREYAYLARPDPSWQTDSEGYVVAPLVNEGEK